MKKFIKKINNAIQWTKKFHFFHIWFSLGFILILLPLSSLILTFLFIILDPSEFSELDRAVGIGFMLDIGFIVLSYVLSFILAIIIEFIILFLYACSIKRTLHVQSYFLLNNKFYNYIYIISIFFLLISSGFLLSLIING